MKVIIGSFQCESNSRAKTHPGLNDFEFLRGREIFRKMPVESLYRAHGITTVPSIYASALPSGTVLPEVYDHFADQILDIVRMHRDADGIFLFLHGSMEVEGSGSGERMLLRKIRAVVPESCLISVALDLHANMTEEIGDYANLVSAFKTAPHVDQKETQFRASEALIDCLEKHVRPYTYVQGIPMLCKGDTMLTGIEPLRTLEEDTLREEAGEGVYGVNLFFGHCWVDAKNTRASVAASADSAEKAKLLAKTYADRLWATRHDYRFLIEARSAEECTELALCGTENRIFLTDSGDNTTAGAEGKSLDLLKLFVQKAPVKRVCIAGITNEEIVHRFFETANGETVTLPILGGLRATVLSHGEILGWAKEIIGRSLSFSIGNIDVIFTELRSAFIEKGNFDRANIDLLSYRIVVVKLGYLFQELKPFADRELFALTDGDSCVELSRLGLQKIVRPLYPLEDFHWSAFESEI